MFSQYTETCEVLLYYPKILDENIKYSSRKDITNRLYADIDVHIKILIAGFPVYGIKCIERLRSHFSNMTFAEKSRYDRIFQQVTHKGG